MREGKLRLVAAKRSAADCRRVMKWRNDPGTLAMFYHSEPKRWPSFFREYKKDYFKGPRLFPQFASYKDRKIGFLRFSDFKGIKGLKKAVEFDINLSPAWRGKGFGARTLKAAQDWVFAKGYRAAVAEVKVKNAASIRAFKKAGFKLLDRRVKRVEDIGKKFKIVRLISYAKK